MNDFTVSFFPVIPVWLTVLIGFFAIFISIKTYNQYDIKPLIKRALILIRFLVFLILLILLLKPSFKTIIEQNDLPKIAFVLDNSESIHISNGRYKGLSDYRLITKQLFDWDTTKVKADYFAFGKTFKKINSVDSLLNNQKDTDLYSALSYITEKENEYIAAVLLSDGKYTINRDPIFSVENATFPIYSIALGDTVTVKDISIKSVTPPAIAYVATPFQVTYRIQRAGFSEKQQVNLELKQNGKRIKRFTKTFEKNQSVLLDTLELTSQEAGLLRWKLDVLAVDGEYTTQNNDAGFAVRIIENKTKIAHIAFGIHPDVKTIRSIVSEMENTEMFVYTWLGGSRFTSPLPSNLSDSIQLFIIHGLPDRTADNAVTDKIATWAKNKPVLWLTLPTKSNSTFDLQPLLTYQPIQSNTSIPFTDSEIIRIQSELNHPILDLPELSPAQLIFKARQRSVVNQSRAKSLLNMGFRGIDLNVPGLSIMQIQHIRYAQVAFFDWYSAYQSGNESRKFVEQLLTNLIEWTSTSPEQKLLELSLPEREISENESFEITSQFKNESLQPVTNGNVTATLFESGKLVSTLTLESAGNGVYKKTVGPFSDGVYTVELSGSVGDQLLDKDKGTFSVSSISNEFRTIERNDQVLANIAYSTNGELVDFEDSKNWLESLFKELSGKQKVNYIQKEITLPELWIWLALIAFLLALEWFIRKILALR